MHLISVECNFLLSVTSGIFRIHQVCHQLLTEICSELIPLIPFPKLGNILS